MPLLSFTLTKGSLEAGSILLAISIILITFLSWRRSSAHAPLPPGPRGLPLVGNILDVPRDQPWRAFRDLSKKYGDVVCVSVLGQTTIVLNSVAAALDLLDKRSSIYSSRPDSIVSISNMLGWEWVLPYMPYDHRWRRARRLFWQYFQPNVVEQWHPSQTLEARRLLRHLLEDPTNVDFNTNLSLTRSLTSTAYGLSAKDVGARFVELLHDAEVGASEAFSPSVLAIPWLRRLPRWFPGGYWQRKLPYWKNLAQKALSLPLEAAQDAMDRGDAKHAMLSRLSDTLEGDELEIKTALAKTLTATTFLAGTDTTSVTLQGFLCAMLLYPEVQKRAQEELDAVVGPDRLPQFDDRASLPYVTAVVKEALRWHNVAPLGLPHSCTADDEYRGWRIPKGATVMANVWGILHDPEHYSNPEAFDPDRFLKDGKLNDEVLDPATVMYGFGRRACPGRYFADNSLFINIASLLHVFNIKPAVDENGAEIPVKYNVTSGLVLMIEPFKCSVHPRSKGAEALVRDGFDVE
ncbi:CyP450 monooxygenase [Cubamyces lactineus]|nr:CyP450 monooxygenase [Cubamyces lactineus]